MLTLYALTSEHIALADSLAESGELSEEQLAAIEANATALESKAAGYVAVARTLDAEAEAMRAEARRLTEAARVRESGAERLRTRLAWALDSAGISRLPTPLGSLSVRNASRPKFEVVGDVEALPTEFQTVKVVVTANDAALLATWKRGGAASLPANVRASVGRSLRVG